MTDETVIAIDDTIKADIPPVTGTPITPAEADMPEEVADHVRTNRAYDEATAAIATETEDAAEEEKSGVEVSYDEEKPAEQSEQNVDQVGLDPVIEGLREARDEDKQTDNSDDDDIDLAFNQIALGKKEELVEDLRKLYPTNKDVQNARSDPNSFLSMITRAIADGVQTGSANSLSPVLTSNEKLGDRLVSQSGCGVPRIPDGSPKNIRHSSVNVSGKEARLLFRAKLGGLYRVNLLNSGFWVALRAPQISELQEFFTMVDLENKEIGRTIGGHFAMVTDLFLKKKFVEMLVNYRIIIESNFKDIYKSGAFVRNLSFHDYDALMHGIVTLMSRNGLRLRLICPKCHQVSIENNVDVSSMKFLNMDLMTEEVRNWWGTTQNEKGEKILRSEEDLRKYRTQILGNKFHVDQLLGANEFDPESGTKFRVNFRVPTMNEFITIGQMLIDKINHTIQAVAKGEEDKSNLASVAMTIHRFQMVAPWIESVSALNPDDSVDFATTDSSVIIDHLDQTIQQGSQIDVLSKLNQFVADTRFNYFGSFSLACPNCGAKPESELDNFFPVELQSIFFGQLFRLLRAAL